MISHLPVYLLSQQSKTAILATPKMIMLTGVKEQHALHGDSATRECSPGVLQSTSSSSGEENLLTIEKLVFNTSLSTPFHPSSFSRLKWQALRSADISIPLSAGTYRQSQQSSVGVDEYDMKRCTSLNKCTKSTTLDMFNTKLLVHTIGTVKPDL